MRTLAAPLPLMLLALGGVSALDPAEYFRWPYRHSPYVVKSNAKDGLPDFSFYAGNMTLTPDTISCPKELQNHCTSSAHPGMKGGQVKCGKDGLQGCEGGLTCFFDNNNINKTEMPTYAPNYVGPVRYKFGKKSRALKLTRKAILQRAVGWLALNSPYFGCKVPAYQWTGLETCAEDDDPKCPQYSFTLTCEGFAAMIVGSPFYGGESDFEHITFGQLQPGDVLMHRVPSGAVAHFVMFREWVATNSTMRVFQMGGGTGSANMAVVSSGPNTIAGQFPWCSQVDESKKACWQPATYKYIVK